MPKASSSLKTYRNLADDIKRVGLHPELQIKGLTLISKLSCTADKNIDAVVNCLL